MKAVTDKNVSGTNADIRRKAFDLACELKSLGDVDILLEGILYERLERRMEIAHEIFFKSTCIIDDSAKDVTSYDVQKAINWIADSESKARKVVIITDNLNNYKSDENIRVLTPSDFVYSANKILQLADKRTFVSIDEFLLAVFFF